MVIVSIRVEHNVKNEFFFWFNTVVILMQPVPCHIFSGFEKRVKCVQK